MFLHIGRLTARAAMELIPAVTRGLKAHDGRTLTARDGRSLAWR